MFWDTLNTLCAKNGISVSKLCALLGLSNSTSTKWKKGALPNNRTMKKIADHFGVSTEYLTGAVPISEVAMVPIYGRVAAGAGMFADDEIIGEQPVFSAMVKNIGECFCLKVSGDSMLPRIQDGDIILVRKQTSVDSGSYAVCSTDNYSCSASLRTEYVELEAGQSLSFDYEIYGNDHFDIWFGVNDQYDMDFLGYGIQPGRYHYIFTAPANGSYSFEWGFSKSGNGQTWCRIDNVAVGWEVPVGSGDVDSSGDVTAADALYVLRYSLGLMELMPWELEEAEVTGDGEVTAADALLILRVALGIITL